MWLYSFCILIIFLEPEVTEDGNNTNIDITFVLEMIYGAIHL